MTVSHHGTSLTAWMEVPRSDLGVSFFERGEWRKLSYVDLAANVRAAASFLVEAGLRRGGVVVLALDTSPAFAAAFFGTLLAGGTACPVPPLALRQDSSEYCGHLAAIFAAAQPDVVIGQLGRERLLDEACVKADIACRAQLLDIEGYDDHFEPQPPAGTALLQFTSGSTGRPRGVQLSPTNLIANTTSIIEWLGCDPDSPTASWLPLHHDMGLIGCFLTSALVCRPLFLMRPMDFLHAPFAWLECFGRLGARYTAVPAFALSYLLRRATRSQTERLDGMDFSQWETLIVGAERVDAAVLGAFSAWLAPQGFDARALRPAYGLAEATLAVTGVRRGSRSRAVQIDWTNVEAGRAVPVRRQAWIGIDPVEPGVSWVTGCGLPLDGVQIDVVDYDGRVVPHGHLGEVHVEAASVCDGYRGDDSVGSSTIREGRLATGDAGFVFDGELFILGRIADRIKVRGQSFFAEDLETQLRVLDNAPGDFVVVPEPSGIHGLVIVSERTDDEWAAEAARTLAAEMGNDVAVRFVTVGRHGIKRTPSGKPRRRLIWNQLLGLGHEPAPRPGPSSSTEECNGA